MRARSRTSINATSTCESPWSGCACAATNQTAASFSASRPSPRRAPSRLRCGTRSARPEILPALGTPTRPAAALLRLVDPQRPAAHVLAIEVLNGARSIGARHLDEREAAGPSRVPIGDDIDRLDGAVLREQGADLVL